MLTGPSLVVGWRPGRLARCLEGHAVANALGGTRTHGLSLRRAALYPTELQALDSRGVVPKEGFEPTHPCGYYVLNVARLPFRHFGTPEFGKHRQNNLSRAFAQAGPNQLHTPSVVLRRSDTALAAHIHKWWAYTYRIEPVSEGHCCQSDQILGSDQTRGVKR